MSNEQLNQPRVLSQEVWRLNQQVAALCDAIAALCELQKELAAKLDSIATARGDGFVINS